MKLNFAAGLEAVAKPKARLSRHRLLVVDDEPTNLRVLDGHLRDHYSVTTCESAHQALELIEAAGGDNDFSVVLTDHMMPRMTGVELCTELRKRGHPAPRIIVTGFAQLGNVVEGINDGAIFGYLTKPVDSSHLLRTISEAVASFDMADQNRRMIELLESLTAKTKMMESLLKDHGEDGHGAESLLSLASEPRRTELAVLFVAVNGLEDLGEGVSADEQVGMLRQILGSVHQAVYAEGGIVDKHIGEGLMAVFGLSGENPAEAASKAVRRIVQTLPEVLAALPPRAKLVKITAGLSVGEVVLGLLGSKQRSELAVIGDTANRAARLREFGVGALREDAGHLGDFERFLVVCDDVFSSQLPEFELAELDGQHKVRDFEAITRLTVKGA
ncbi:MAG: response regulator [Myxococcota bacterium]|nr:response regulator [Myxococcota bacterium]